MIVVGLVVVCDADKSRMWISGFLSALSVGMCDVCCADLFTRHDRVIFVMQ